MTSAPPEAFRLPCDPGARFALYRPAACDATPRGAILYVPPFAEEMNKSRRMAALQARAFAAVGYAVLCIDLFGCGDSDGDFRAARWHLWKRDIAQGTQWLEHHAPAPIHLWGLRLGATLALDCWQDAPARYASAVIWQPVHDGKTFLTQFLRLAVAREALDPRGVRTTTDTLRGKLANGETLEVAGYALAPELAWAIDSQQLANFSVPHARVHWLEVKTVPSDPSPAVQSTLSSWRSRGADADYRVIPGQSFWSSVELGEVPDLIAATTSLYAS